MRDARRAGQGRRNITKSFGKAQAVEGVLACRFRKGQIHGVLGPNGAGKTTTLRMLLGIIDPG